MRGHDVRRMWVIQSYAVMERFVRPTIRARSTSMVSFVMCTVRTQILVTATTPVMMTGVNSVYWGGWKKTSTVPTQRSQLHVTHHVRMGVPALMTFAAALLVSTVPVFLIISGVYLSFS